MSKFVEVHIVRDSRFCYSECFSAKVYNVDSATGEKKLSGDSKGYFDKDEAWKFAHSVVENEKRFLIIDDTINGI